MDILLTAVRLALGSLVANKARSILTMVGLLIGVAAVMTVLSATQASAEAIDEEFAESTAMLTVSPMGLNVASARLRAAPMISLDDARAITQDSRSSAGVVSIVEQSVLAISGERNANTRITGYAGRLFEMYGLLPLARGELWPEDDAVHSAIIVLGAAVSEKLFGAADPIGRPVRIGRTHFRVVGVVAKRGIVAGREVDDRIYMPLNVLRARIVPARDGRVDNILVRPTSTTVADAAKKEIRSIIGARHHGRVEVKVSSAEDALRAKKELADTMALLLFAVATVSMVVGGVGVMNIMLVSVAERTHEIGIRVSIGAQAKDILLQYLIEAVVLTLVGGIFGVIAGLFGSASLAAVLDVPVSYSARAAAASLAASVAIGVVFGLFPAWRASGIDPVEALRTE